MSAHTRVWRVGVLTLPSFLFLGLSATPPHASQAPARQPTDFPTPTEPQLPRRSSSAVPSAILKRVSLSLGKQTT